MSRFSMGNVERFRGRMCDECDEKIVIMWGRYDEQHLSKNELKLLN